MPDTITPGLGHNNPPDPIEILRAQLVETHADLMKRSRELLDLANRLPTTMDDEWEAKISEAIKSCTKFTKNAEATRLAANEPYRALIAATDGFFKSMTDKVDALKRTMAEKYLTPYQQVKADAEKRRREEEAREARARAEEAARIAREEAQRAAEAKRREEAAKAEADRLRRERIEADERRKREEREAAERAEAARQAAIKAEEEATNKRKREQAARAREAAEREEKARQEKAREAERKEQERERAERADAARLEAEAKAERKEQERAAAEARDRAAAAERIRNKTGRAERANSAELSRTRTDLGAVASLRTIWQHEVVEPALVPRPYLRVDDSAIAAAVKAATIDGKCDLKIKGVRIYPVADSVVR